MDPLIVEHYLAEVEPKAQPSTLTLIGGPVDPDPRQRYPDLLAEHVTASEFWRWGTGSRRIGIAYRVHVTVIAKLVNYSKSR